MKNRSPGCSCCRYFGNGTDWASSRAIERSGLPVNIFFRYGACGDPRRFWKKRRGRTRNKRNALKMNAGTPHRQKPLKRRRCGKSGPFSFLARCGQHSRSFLRSVCECTPHRPTPLFSSLHKNNSEYAEEQTPPPAITGGGVPFRFCLLNLYYLRF